MKKLFSRFTRHQQGVALIEFAIVFPFMFLLLFAGIELTRYVLIIQKVEKSAYVLTDITGQYAPATTSASTGEINVTRLTTEVFPQFHRMMGSYGNPAYEAIVMTSVMKTSGGVKILWQRYSAGGDVTVQSVVTNAFPTNTSRSDGSSCTTATFNADINTQLTTMLPGENMLIGEVFFHYKPIVTSLLGVTTATGVGPFGVAERTISRQLFIHPRGGDLLTLPPNTPVSAGPCT